MEDSYFQGYASKCLTISFSGGGKKSLFVAFVNFHGMNLPTIASIKLTV